MSFYSGLAKTAKQLLKKYGQSVAISRKSGGVFDPASGTTTGEAQSAFTANGVVLDYKTALVDGSSIRAGDKRIILESGNAPKIGDTIVTALAVGSCVNFTTLSPAGEVVIYELQVRY